MTRFVSIYCARKALHDVQTTDSWQRAEGRDRAGKCYAVARWGNWYCGGCGASVHVVEPGS